jgi:hypothetical protein
VKKGKYRVITMKRDWKKFWKLLSTFRISVDMDVTIFMEIKLIQFKAHTWKCIHCIVMRKHKDAMKMMALYLWKWTQRKILAILREAICFKIIIIRICKNFNLECMYLQSHLSWIRLNAFGITTFRYQEVKIVGWKFNS